MCCWCRLLGGLGGFLNQMVPNTGLDILSFLLAHAELEGGMTTDQDSLQA